jgi:hypothetical protein
MNKDYNEKLDYLMKYLSKESIATMLLNTSEGDKLVSNYIEIRQIENITNLKKVKVEDKKIEKLKIYDNSIEWCCNGRAINDTEKDIINKINEIIDRLNGKDNE